MANIYNNYKWRGSGQEELPHVRGQGQWPRVPGCDCAGMAERSYPVQGRGGGRPGGATPRLRSGAAGRSYPTPLSPSSASYVD